MSNLPIFDVAGSSLFPEDVPTMLAILNSSAVRQLLAAINPTVNFQVGDLRELPIPRGSSDVLRADVLRASGRNIVDLTLGEPDFPTPPHIVEAAAQAMRVGETRYTAAAGTTKK